MIIDFQAKRGTATQWSAANPALSDGVFGIVTDSAPYQFKIGDGVTAWNDLSFSGGGADGADGLSAYEIAVNSGFVGTEQEWLNSLVGSDGTNGVGVPVGGTTGQVLKKTSNTDYDTVWADETGGGGQTTDIQAALDGAAAPSASNVFATIADLSSGGDMTAEEIETALDAYYAGTNWRTQLTPSQVVSAINSTLGQTDWQGGEAPVIEDIQKYATVADLPAITGSETDLYAMVTTDTDKSLNGMYGIVGGSWKLMYDMLDIFAPFNRTSVNEIRLDYEYDGTPTDGTEEGVINGYRFNNQADGIVADANYYITDFIPVKFGDKLVKTASTGFWWYRADKTPIAWSEGIIPYNYSGAMNINNEEVAYIRWTSLISNKGVGDMIVQRYNMPSGTAIAGWTDFNDSFTRDNDRFVFEDEGVIWKKFTTNIFDPRKADYNRYNYQGSWNGGASTGLLKIKPGIPWSRSGDASAYTLFDEDKNYISTASNYWTLPPANARYVSWWMDTAADPRELIVTQNIVTRSKVVDKVSSSDVEKGVVVETSVCTVGDSIGTEAGTYAERSAFGTDIKEGLRLKDFHNVSVSGKSYSTYSADINSGLYTMPVADVYVLQIGTNDFTYSREIGAITDDATADTFYGNMQDVIENLLTLNPNAKLLFLTPIPRADMYTNSAAGTILQDYADAIIKKADSLGCDYLDLMECGLNPFNDQIKANFFITGDGVHPTDEAHKAYIYPKVSWFLKSHLK